MPLLYYCLSMDAVFKSYYFISPEYGTYFLIFFDLWQSRECFAQICLPHHRRHDRHQLQWPGILPFLIQKLLRSITKCLFCRKCAYTVSLTQHSIVKYVAYMCRPTMFCRLNLADCCIVRFAHIYLVNIFCFTDIWAAGIGNEACSCCLDYWMWHECK